MSDKVYSVKDVIGLRAAWFQKGVRSVKRQNKSGCVCQIEDDDTISALCLAHKEYIDSLVMLYLKKENK